MLQLKSGISIRGVQSVPSFVILGVYYSVEMLGVIMGLQEALSIMGIQNKWFSLEDLDEFYAVRLEQNKVIHSNTNREIKEAYKVARKWIIQRDGKKDPHRNDPVFIRQRIIIIILAVVCVVLLGVCFYLGGKLWM